LMGASRAVARAKAPVTSLFLNIIR
jgi:hypothetical protein